MTDQPLPLDKLTKCQVSQADSIQSAQDAHQGRPGPAPARVASGAGDTVLRPALNGSAGHTRAVAPRRKCADLSTKLAGTC